jgi:phospholipid/cholesterol/gamma-HCH transport system substrate-binding protein
MGGAQRALVGAFLIGATLLFAVGLFLIGDRRLLFAEQFELDTTLGRVTGLQIGSKVRVAGLDAGEVVDIGLPSRPSERFRVRMRLREDLRPLIRTDSAAAVQTDGIVGAAFIQISRGTDEAPMVMPGGTIAGRDPIEFADLIQDGRETFLAVGREVAEVADAVHRAIETLTETTRVANYMIDGVGEDVQTITAASGRILDDIQGIVGDARVMVADVQAGRGTIGKLFTDDTHYQHWLQLTREAEQTVANLRLMTQRATELVESLSAEDGTAQQIVGVFRDTLADTREVVADLSEGTEALKRNFLFRGFFRDRGFFDLDTISREAYLSGALEGSDRTALRVWIDADGLFARDAEGLEQLTADGRRRLDSAMADLVRYPRDSPLVVEGYADVEAGEVAFLVSSDRARLVREYLLARFGRRANLTGAMALSDDAPTSPTGDGRWSGVALALFVPNDVFAAP